MFADLAYFTVILAAIQARYGRVSADSCFNVGYAPNGVCNSDPKAPEYLQAVIVQDHKDPNCSDSGIFALAAQYVDVNGATSSVKALNAATIGAAFTGTMTFNFPVPLATIGDRSPVTLQLSASSPGATGSLTANIKYSQKHSPTLVYTTSTTATTVTAFATATTTMTVTVSGETTVTPINRKTVTKFGVQTIATPSCTVWANNTVKPRDRTIIVTKKSIITQAATCLPTQAPLAPTANLRFKRDINYSIPYCGVPVTTVIPVSTLVQKITTTNIDIVTALSTSTLLKTETDGTATIYSGVTSTKIVDNGICKTKTAWMQASRSTSSVVKLATTTVYSYPSDAALPPCGNNITPAVTARISNFMASKLLSSTFSTLSTPASTVPPTSRSESFRASETRSTNTGPNIPTTLSNQVSAPITPVTRTELAKTSETKSERTVTVSSTSSTDPGLIADGRTIVPVVSSRITTAVPTISSSTTTERMATEGGPLHTFTLAVTTTLHPETTRIPESSATKTLMTSSTALSSQSINSTRTVSVTASVSASAEVRTGSGEVRGEGGTAGSGNSGKGSKRRFRRKMIRISDYSHVSTDQT